MDQGIAIIIAAVIGGIFLLIQQRNSKKLNEVQESTAQTKESVKELSASVPTWKLLLEHDENGKIIKGSVVDLINAVYEGYPVKIRFNRTKDHFEVMDAQWLFVDKDKNLVHASNISQISLTDDAKGNYAYLTNPYHYFVVVNNSGYHHAKRVNISGEDKDPTDDKRHMTWIGLIPPNL